MQDTWSKYTYYEHPWTTFAPLTPELELKADANIVSIEVSHTLPDYEALAEDNDKALQFMKNLDVQTTSLRITDGVYVLGANEFSLTKSGSS